MRPRGKRQTTPHTLSEEAAVEVMFEYFQKNRATLPLSITKRRDRIVELLMQGLSPEEAFSQAI
jgi:hypothetical protein